MTIGDIFKQRKKRWDKLKKVRKNEQGGKECPNCHVLYTSQDLKKELLVCPGCGYHFPLGASDRIELLCDQDSFREMNGKVKLSNPLQFPDYDKQWEKNYKKTGQADALMTGTAKLEGIKVAIAVLDSRFLMGSMGTVVGEKLVSLVEYASRKKLPLLVFSASGGARMQEGMYSLLQMARTSTAIQRFQQKGGLYISCMTHPTTGGVSASFASLGDINLAEPGALIGFAGPRVIEQTIGQKLPEGFQRSEFLLKHGMLDRIVERKDMKKTLVALLRLHGCV